MTVEKLIKQARGIWPKKMTEEQIAVAMSVVCGDICRYIRDKSEGKDVDEAVLKKELGNMIFSTIRWCDDLGFSPEDCIELAKTAQRNYAAKLAED